jgi:hypothetical protein
MTTLIFIENVLGSGQVVKLTEDFGDQCVSRDLRPGEHARLVVSPFKMVTVEEIPLAQAQTRSAANEERRVISLPVAPTLARRCG